MTGRLLLNLDEFPVYVVPAVTEPLILNLLTSGTVRALVVTPQRATEEGEPFDWSISVPWRLPPTARSARRGTRKKSSGP